MKKKLQTALIILVAGLLTLGCLVQITLAEDKYGGKFTLSFNRGAGQFGYPLNIRHSDSNYAWWGGLQGLVQLSTAELGRWDPCLAESWELAPDKSSYTFHLRKGVKFHDGTDFNAEAVKWNLEKVMVSAVSLLKKVKSIEIIDDYTVRFNLSDWDAVVLDDFGNPVCWIISPTAYEKNGGEDWANTNPVGTGPFKIKEYRRSQYVKYERNNNYWEKGLPYLDAFEVFAIADPMTAIASLKRGEIIGIRDADAITANQLVGQGYEFATVAGGRMGIEFNSTDKTSVWSDKRMREALEYAINKEEICASLGFGFVQPSYEIMVGIHEVGNPGTSPRKYDPQKARQLMAEAGYPKGLKIRCTFSASFKSDHLLALQSNLAAVGIELEINTVQANAYVQMSRSPASNNDIRYGRNRGGAPLLNQAISEISSQSMYFVGVKRSEGFDDKVFEASKTPDLEKQMKFLEEAERIAYEDCMIVPLWTDPSINIHVPELKDAVWWVGKPYTHFERAWLERRD